MPRPRNRNRRDRGVRRRARRDIRTAFAPQFAELDRQGTQAGREAEQYQGQVSNLYTGLGGQLGQIGADFQAQLPGIQQGYQAAVGQLASQIPTGLPAAEGAAGGALFGAVGAGGLERLASAGQRGATSNASSLRQAAIDATNYQAAIGEDLQNFRQALREGRMDLVQQMGPMILSRIDELKDRAQQLRLAKQEFQLRQTATMQGLGLDQARFGLDRRQFAQGLQSQQGWEAFLRRLLQQANRGGP